MKLGFSGQIFEKYLISNFRKIRLIGVELSPKKDMELHFCLEGFVDVSSTVSLFTPYNGSVHKFEVFDQLLPRSVLKEES
jgi:hypothetical protein